MGEILEIVAPYLDCVQWTPAEVTLWYDNAELHGQDKVETMAHEVATG